MFVYLFLFMDSNIHLNVIFGLLKLICGPVCSFSHAFSCSVKEIGY